MSSPARRRRNRLARKRSASQKAARVFAKRCCRETQIVSYAPDDVKDVTPFDPVASIAVQEPLGEEFERVLYDNLPALYARS